MRKLNLTGSALKKRNKGIAGLWRDRRGTTAIEYALIVGLVALALIAVTSNVGTNLSTSFQKVSSGLGAGGSSGKSGSELSGNNGGSGGNPDSGSGSGGSSAASAGGAGGGNQKKDKNNKKKGKKGG